MSSARADRSATMRRTAGGNHAESAAAADPRSSAAANPGTSAAAARPAASSSAGGRSAGGFRRHRSTHPRSVPSGTPDRSGGSCTVRKTTAAGWPVPNGRRPDDANASTQPSANTSAAGPASPAPVPACSGAR